MRKNNAEIKGARRILYHLLLHKIHDKDMTDNEIEIMGILAKDIQIQEILRDALEKEKNDL